jgi:hypothetical protein
LSGRSVVIVGRAVLETDAAASALLESLHALAPEMDAAVREAISLLQPRRADSLDPNDVFAAAVGPA